MKKLTHIDDQGKATMVDVGHKPIQRRVAKASGRIDLSLETVALIHEDRMKKGDVLTVAQIAGIQAGKRTSDLIPLCHPLPLNSIKVELSLDALGVVVKTQAACAGRTGVEMEALTAASVALLTVYDMCKAVDKAMIIRDIRLDEKNKYDMEES
jgi:cyclic pyranopterin monophosphate synthase